MTSLSHMLMASLAGSPQNKPRSHTQNPSHIINPAHAISFSSLRHLGDTVTVPHREEHNHTHPLT